MELNRAEKELLALLMEIPPQMEGAERMLSGGGLTAENVTRVRIQYAEECFDEMVELSWEHDHPWEGAVPDLHSSYILDVVKLLLRFGLEPNGIYEDSNIMDSVRYVKNEYLSADALDLPLQNGGDTDLEVNGEEFFRSLDFDLFFDAAEQYCRPKYASLVHCRMVAVGHRAERGQKVDRVEVFREYSADGLGEVFDLRKLRDHRRYYFGLTHLEDDFALSICDRDTLWEVARAV